MTKFVLLVFGFLAVAFYEMSGGADFSATAVRMAAVEARKTQSVSAETPANAISQSDLVARSSLNLVSFAEVAGESLEVSKDDPELLARAVPAAAVTGVVAQAALSEPETLQQATALPGAAPVTSASAPRTAGFDAASDEAPAPSILDERAAVGLETTAIRFEGSTSRASSQDVATQLPQIASPGLLQPQQIRRVNGDLVNMRTGPGTSNAVIGQLPRGAAVEILGDNGAGWVRLRPVDGGPEGWVADFLLTRG